FLTRLGDHVLLVWEDGFARHFLFRGGELGHEGDLDLLEGRGGRVTALTPLLGETTVVVADDGGFIAGWFPARPAAETERRAQQLAIRAYQTEIYALRGLLVDAGVPDYELPYAGVEREGLSAAAEAALDDAGRRRVDEIIAGLPPLWSAIETARANLIEAGRQRFLRGPGFEWEAAGHPTALAPSGRSRLMAVGSSAGEVGLVQVNCSEVIGETELGGGAIESLVMAPKENAAFVRQAGAIHHVALDPGYPEASFGSMFRPVWYEGLDAPAHRWQSTGGTDAFEPKLGLIPLVFGTIKATIYSMLFGAPLALLAAIYSSEFLKPRLRASLKSILELMASLPSVVLGFLAALIIAPYVQEVLSGVLAFFLTLPFTLVLGANLWQLMPRRRAILWSGWQRFAAIVLALPVSVWLAGSIGPLVERLFFSGNIDLWLDGQLGNGTGGWLLLLLPLSALVVILVLGRVVNPRLRAASATWEHGKTTRVELGKFLAATVVTVLVAVVLANVASTAGFDPRGTIVDNYVQRNALVVGFVMGFAVIPIIYTLAEDALSSVPSHLRDASLGCGATPWQTAVRVIVPTAMSGLFSAVMIGLGRAVGETMIVL
ncbi:MAG: ABC transporter permease subunit, partial [Planctomycetota bacterium]